MIFGSLGYVSILLVQIDQFRQKNKKRRGVECGMLVIDGHTTSDKQVQA